MVRRTAALWAAFFLCAIGISAAHAQAVLQQLGQATAGHLAMYLGNGLVADAGGPASANTTPPNMTNAGTLPSGLALVNGGQGLALYSGYASAPYSEFKFGFDGSGNGVISLDQVGGTAPPALSLQINGTSYPLPNTLALDLDGSNGLFPTILDNLGGSQIPRRNPKIVCDGVTDNQPAIQAAINALEATSPSGGLVPLPACDNIAVYSEILIHKPNIWLVGAGSGQQSTYNTPSFFCGSSHHAAATALCYHGQPVVFTASVAGTTMTVSAVTSGPVIVPGMYLSGAGVANGIYVVKLLTGPGGAGSTYEISKSLTIASEAVTAYGNLVRFEPNDGDGAITGGGVEDIALAGRGLAGSDLVVRTVRGATFARVYAENCVNTCVVFDVTTHNLQASGGGSEFCDNTHDRIADLYVYNDKFLAAVANADGILLTGRLNTSAVPYGCNPANLEANTSYNVFDNLRSVSVNGRGLVFGATAENVFNGVTWLRADGSGWSLEFLCADGDALQARRNVIEDLYSTGQAVSDACNTHLNITTAAGDSAYQNQIMMVAYSATANTVKPRFSAYAPEASLFWRSTDGDGDWTLDDPQLNPGPAYLADNTGTVTDGAALTPSTIYCRPFIVRSADPIQMIKLALRIGVGHAGGHVQLALYANSGGGNTPGTFIANIPALPTDDSNTIQTGTLPDVTGTDAPPVVGSGTYYGRRLWYCTNTDDATAQFGTFGLNSAIAMTFGSLTSAADVLTAPVQGLFCAGTDCTGGSSTYGTWPATLAGSTWTDVITDTIPAMSFHVASQ